MKPFIHKFKTKNNLYVYDVNTNEFLLVDEIIFGIVDYIYDKTRDWIVNKFSAKYPKNSINQSLDRIIKSIKEDKLFLSTQPKHLKFYDKEKVKDKLDNELEDLILNVTEQCNLRCKYCVYSAHYFYERKHSSSVMSEPVALKSIDFFFTHNKNSKHIFISFYGGEPLLNFKLIKKSVEYAKKKNKAANKKLYFNITTNGTILNSEIIDFYLDNGIGLCISLDGPKNIHDRYRTYQNGKGSFDVIIKNIEKIKKKSSEYYDQKISYNMVVAPPYDLLKSPS